MSKNFLDCFTSAANARACAMELNRVVSKECECGGCVTCNERKHGRLTRASAFLDYYILNGNEVVGGLNQYGKWCVLSRPYELTYVQKKELNSDREIHLTPDARSKQLAIMRKAAKQAKAGQIHNEYRILILPPYVSMDWLKHLTTPAKRLCPVVVPFYDAVLKRCLFVAGGLPPKGGRKPNASAVLLTPSGTSILLAWNKKCEWVLPESEITDYKINDIPQSLQIFVADAQEQSEWENAIRDAETGTHPGVKVMSNEKFVEWLSASVKMTKKLTKEQCDAKRPAYEWSKDAQDCLPKVLPCNKGAAALQAAAATAVPGPKERILTEEQCKVALSTAQVVDDDTYRQYLLNGDPYAPDYQDIVACREASIRVPPVVVFQPADSDAVAAVWQKEGTQNIDIVWNTKGEMIVLAESLPLADAPKLREYMLIRGEAKSYETKDLDSYVDTVRGQRAILTNNGKTAVDNTSAVDINADIKAKLRSRNWVIQAIQLIIPKLPKTDPTDRECAEVFGGYTDNDKCMRQCPPGNVYDSTHKACITISEWKRFEEERLMKLEDKKREEVKKQAEVVVDTAAAEMLVIERLKREQKMGDDAFNKAAKDFDTTLRDYVGHEDKFNILATAIEQVKLDSVPPIKLDDLKVQIDDAKAKLQPLSNEAEDISRASDTLKVNYELVRKLALTDDTKKLMEDIKKSYDTIIVRDQAIHNREVMVISHVTALKTGYDKRMQAVQMSISDSVNALTTKLNDVKSLHSRALGEARLVAVDGAPQKEVDRLVRELKSVNSALEDLNAEALTLSKTTDKADTPQIAVEKKKLMDLQSAIAVFKTQVIADNSGIVASLNAASVNFPKCGTKKPEEQFVHLVHVNALGKIDMVWNECGEWIVPGTDIFIANLLPIMRYKGKLSDADFAPSIDAARKLPKLGEGSGSQSLPKLAGSRIVVEEINKGIAFYSQADFKYDQAACQAVGGDFKEGRCDRVCFPDQRFDGVRCVSEAEWKQIQAAPAAPAAPVAPAAPEAPSAPTAPVAPSAPSAPTGIPGPPPKKVVIVKPDKKENINPSEKVAAVVGGGIIPGGLLGAIAQQKKLEDITKLDQKACEALGPKVASWRPANGVYEFPNPPPPAICNPCTDQSKSVWAGKRGCVSTAQALPPPPPSSPADLMGALRARLTARDAQIHKGGEVSKEQEAVNKKEEGKKERDLETLRNLIGKALDCRLTNATAAEYKRVATYLKSTPDEIVKALSYRTKVGNRAAPAVGLCNLVTSKYEALARDLYTSLIANGAKCGDIPDDQKRLEVIKRVLNADTRFGERTKSLTKFLSEQVPPRNKNDLANWDQACDALVQYYNTVPLKPPPPPPAKAKK